MDKNKVPPLFGVAENVIERKFPIFQAMPVPNGMLLTIIRSDIEQAQIFVSNDNMDKLFLVWGVKASDALLMALAKMRLDERKLVDIRNKVKRGELTPKIIGED